MASINVPVSASMADSLYMCQDNRTATLVRRGFPAPCIHAGVLLTQNAPSVIHLSSRRLDPREAAGEPSGS